MNKHAQEFLKQADIIVDRSRWWSLRCRYARPDQIKVEKPLFEAEMTSFFFQLKQFFCEHREEIIRENLENMDKAIPGLAQAIEAMDSVIQDDLEREFGLASRDNINT